MSSSPASPDAVDRVAVRSAFSGVVRVDRDGTIEVAAAYGMANRALRVPNTADTIFGIASGVKGPTALVIADLIAGDRLAFNTPVRTLLGDDLPLIDDGVTIEHLLAHRSGIGDYLDEEAGGDISDHVMAVPVHELDTTAAYLKVLDGHPTKFPADERFGYCNSGYVILALVAERVTGKAFNDLVDAVVCAPAEMRDTGFLRSDELPPRTATGYLDAEGLRTNVLHLPVRGSGDGGLYSTAADMHAFWTALLGGRIVAPEMLAHLLRPRSDVPSEGMRYGMGFWRHPTGDAASLVGYDAGVSFRSVHDPASGLTHTVLSNTSEGAWALSEYLDEALGIVEPSAS